MNPGLRTAAQALSEKVLPAFQKLSEGENVIGNMRELADGFYYRKQTPSGEGFRVAVAKTTDSSVDQKHVPAVMLIGKAGIERLDATVASRAADATGAKEATLTEIKGGGWASASDTLEKIREAISNVPAQRRTQEI